MGFFKKQILPGWTVFRTAGNRLSMLRLSGQEKNRYKVEFWTETELELDNEDAVALFLSQYQVNQHHCIALLNRDEYQILKTDALDVPENEAKEAVRWSIKDMLEYPVIEASVDMLKIPHDEESEYARKFLLAVVAHHDVITERVTRLVEYAEAGLEVVDIIETGQRNIAALLEQENRGLALLSFNEEGGLLTLTANGELFHSLSITTTAVQLQQGDEFEQSMAFERIALDLQRTLDNFERQFSFVAITRLVVAPFGMRSELVEYLIPYLSVPVETFELSDYFDFSEVPELAEDVEQQASALQLLGSALREEVS